MQDPADITSHPDRLIPIKNKPVSAAGHLQLRNPRHIPPDSLRDGFRQTPTRIMFLSSRALSAFLIPLLAAAPLAADPYLLTPRLADNPSFQYTPSPADWRDVNVYQIFTDRFHDGDPSNNNARTMRAGTGWYGEQTSGKSWHNSSNSSNANERHLAQGGDWEGLRQKIPYLVSMGVKSVWISSVQKTEQGADKRYTPYHAYHPTDFYRCEPLFGDLAKLRQTIDELHANGIYVILDVVPNHLADLAGLGNGQDDFYHPNGGGNLFWWDGTRHAFPFDRLDWLHNHGKILNWDAYPETQRGAFVGTDDLATDRQDVRDALDAAFKNLIDATDCDGFRVDAIKHVDHTWIKNWATSMRQHAALRGKANFLVFGELFSFDDNFHSFFTQDQGSGFNSVMWFTMMNTLRDVFAGSGSTSNLTGQLDGVHNQGRFGEGGPRAITFIDNHDVDRVALNYGSSWVDMLRPAMGLLYCAAPVPTILYGTEHGFNQGGKPNTGLDDGDYQRECMMNYGFQWGNAQGDKFNAPSPIKDLIGALNQARASYSCLRRGGFTQRWQSSGRGIYAFTRALGQQEALVVLNTHWDQTLSCTPAVGKPNGTVFTNILNPVETATVADGTLSTSIPTRGLKVFVAGEPDAPPSTMLAVSDTRHWPTSGNIGSSSTVYIDSNTSPKGAAVSGEVIVSIDNGQNWTANTLSRNPPFDGAQTDAWNANLGSFPAGTTVLYAVNFTDAGGLTRWDSDNGANYRFTVNPGSGGDLLNWFPQQSATPAGASYEFEITSDWAAYRNAAPARFYRLALLPGTPPVPAPAATLVTTSPATFDAGQPVVLTARSEPAGSIIAVSVVYNTDPSAAGAWPTAEFIKTGVTGGGDNWSADLGDGFTAGQTIHYAVRFQRADGGADIWQNNGGSNHTVTISGP